MKGKILIVSYLINASCHLSAFNNFNWNKEWQKRAADNWQEMVQSKVPQVNKSLDLPEANSQQLELIK
jgi:hypothetical protein